GLVSSVAASVTGAVIAAGLSGWVAAARSGPGIALVITAALALVLAAGVVALPIQPGWLAAVLTIWLAAGVGLLAGHLLPETNWDLGLIVGTVAGITMATLRVLLTNDHRYRQPLVGLAAAIAPAAIFGILVYAISWIVL
ncbi:MAG: hypothetical protein FWG25_10955, partial [Promicromonosporaceae bacterium]|nr:hypothetical protein [Promicromonosporaceae bacterium]